MNRCPSMDILQQFLAGELTERQAGAVNSHAAACRRCQEVLEKQTVGVDAEKWRRFEASRCARQTESRNGGSDASLNFLQKIAERPPRRTEAICGRQVKPSVPGYEILDVIGRGGMGVVYKARHISLNRIVAIKMILSGAHASMQETDRFRREAEAVARLQHPNIVQIYDIGSAGGQPYFSLEYVEGISLAERLAKTPQPPEWAARLMSKLARAVHAAHGQGIIHRDLKPANVLLTVDEEPKITDFGLSKQMEGSTGQSASEALIGTPSYMAPEQAGRKQRTTGTGADVYGLGAILYEMLTGRPPFKAANSLDTLLQVIHEEPIAPRRLEAAVPRDLETICLKCLQKSPAQRYRSCNELADDLSRWLKGEPIKARPVGKLERLGRWARRNPVVAGLAALAAFLLLAGTGVSTFFGIQATMHANRATVALASVEEQLYLNTIGLADREWSGGNVARALELLDSCPVHLRHWEWHYLRRRSDGSLRTLASSPKHISTVTYDRNGKRIASATQDGEIMIHDLVTGRKLLSFMAHEFAIHNIQFSPNGDTLASAGNNQVCLWNANSGKRTLRIGLACGRVFALCFSSNGKQLAIGGENGSVSVRDSKTGSSLTTLKGHAHHVRCVAFDPTGTLLVSAGGRLKTGEVRLWDLTTGKTLYRREEDYRRFRGAFFSPDGKHLILASEGSDIRLHHSGQIKVIDVQTKEEKRLMYCEKGIQTAAISFGGERIAVGLDSVIRVFATDTGEPLTTFRGHRDIVTGLSFRPGGSWLASASWDGTVKIWGIGKDPDSKVFQNHTGIVVNAVQYSESGLLASGGDDERLVVWNARTGKQVFAAEQASPWRGVLSVAFSPDAKHIYSAGRGKIVQCWNIASGKVQRSFHHSGVLALALSHDGTVLATASDDGAIALWNAQTGERLRQWVGHDGQIRSIAFNKNGQRLTSGGQDKTIKIWETATGRKLLTLHGHALEVDSVVFSPSGDRIVSCSDDFTVRIWRLTDGKELFTLRGHTFKVTDVAISPDGNRIASASVDKTVRIWNAQTGQQMLALTAHKGGTTAVDFSQDGRFLASSSWDGTVRVWDGRPAE